MMKIEFSTSSAAFIDDIDTAYPQADVLEAARILECLRKDILSGKTEGRIFDINGNVIGKWESDLTGD